MKASMLILVCACGQVDTPSNPDATAADDAAGDAGSIDAPGDGGLGAWSTPVSIAAVSVPGFDDSYAAIRADGLELIFASDRDGSWDLYVSTRFTATDPWGAPTRVVELDTSGSTETGPELSDDGKQIWFARSALTEGRGFDIYTASRASPSNPWGVVTKLEELRTGGSERAPHVSPDGKTLWYARGPQNVDYDIWVATRGSASAPWANLREVSRFTSTGVDDNPTATGDGLVMYFDSDRSGAVTMYTSTRPPGGTWSEPVEVPELVGFQHADITPDGRMMVLARTEPDGTTDLYESRR